MSFVKVSKIANENSTGAVQFTNGVSSNGDFTGQGGLNVTGVSTFSSINVTGNAAVTGVVTARSNGFFVGDGSRITNVPGVSKARIIAAYTIS